MSYENINPTVTREFLSDTDQSVIDVRTVAEFDSGHVPGSFNIPLMFKGMTGMSPNPDFLAVMQRHFKPDAKLVFV